MKTTISVEGSDEDTKQFLQHIKDINFVGLSVIHHRMRSTIGNDADALRFYDEKQQEYIEYSQEFKNAQL